MHGLSISRRAAKLSLRSHDRLNKALGAVIEPLERRALLSAGDPVGSPIFTDFGTGTNTESGGAIAVLSNGKFLQAGVTTGMGATQIGLARFNADGSNDNSFGPDGDGSNQVTASLPSTFTDNVGDVYSITAVNAVAVDPNSGQIIVVGVANNDSAGDPDWLIASFTADGDLDAANFGTGGVVISNFTTTLGIRQINEARAVAIQSDGKLVVAGSDTSSGSFQGFTVARYNTNGSLDDGSGTDSTPLDGAFGTSGVVHSYFGFNFEDKANAVAIDGSGNIIVAGTSRDSLNFSDIGPHIAVRKYSSSGASLASVREAYLSASPIFGDNAYTVAVDSSNRIIVGGNTDSPELASAQDFVLIRYDNSLARDGGFGIGGVTTTDFSDISPFWSPAGITDLAIQSDGMIVAGGSVITCDTNDCGNVVTSDFVVARYSATGMTAGQLDAGFGDSGLAYYSNGELFFPDSNLVSIGIQNDTTGNNQVVAFGSWVPNGASQDLILGRYDLAVAAAGSGGSTNVSVSGPGSTTEGSTVTFGGTATSGGGSGTSWLKYQHRATTAVGGGGPITSVTINWGDGSALQTVAVVAGNYSANHTYVDDNPSVTSSDVYSVTVTAGTATASQNITVNNAAPSVAAIAGPSSGVRAFSQSFSSTFSDVGTQDTWTVAWDFGDGNTQSGSGSPGSLSVSHVYAASGTYTVTLTVSDDDSGSAVQTKVITISDSSQSGGVLMIGGTSGNDVIQAKMNSGFNVTFNGVNTVYSGVTTVIIAGGAGADDIRINPNVTLTAVLFGGTGNDSLKGGGGADILVGGDGNDLLEGQDGRDIMIGGDGADSIVGNKDDDILVAGFTKYDSDANALLTVLSEWTSSRTYTQRVNNVMGTSPGTRNNGTTYLKPYDSVANNSDATVFDDQDADILTGSQGQDLFLFNSDTSGQDTITDLSSSEFAADIDWILAP